MNDLCFMQDRGVTSAFIDSSVRLSVVGAILMVQDNLTECFSMLGCDGIVYKKKYNAFWVFTKTRARFLFSPPEWKKKITAKTFPIDNKGFRTHINTLLLDERGAFLVANQEACVLSLENHRPLKITSLPYPKENFLQDELKEDFQKFPPCDSAKKIYSQQVHSQHIDMSQHLNNIEYIRFALSCFSVSFLLQHTPTLIEMHYLGETKENAILDIYMTQENTKGNYEYYIYIKEEKRLVFEMLLEFNEIV